MAKAIRSFPVEQQKFVATRRLAAGPESGLSYWAAKDYFAKKGKNGNN
jgi:hypothetical protein